MSWESQRARQEFTIISLLVFQVILYIIETSEREILALKSFDLLISYMKEAVPDKISASASFEYHVSVMTEGGCPSPNNVAFTFLEQYF